jgi:hypothetical protein
MVTERIDVRLDPERRRKLAQLSKDRGISISKVIREAIDLLYETDRREQRMKAAKAIAAMEIEALPDPEELSRQLRKMHGFDPLP